MLRPKAVLFDVGGPLDDEVAWERAVDAALQAAVVEITGAPPDPAGFAAAAQAAVASFAPNTYQAILTQLLGPEAAATAWPGVLRRLTPRPGFRFREGLGPMLAQLQARGLRLGLAANQAVDVLVALDAAGLGGFFTGRAVSGTLGLRKPDPRLFLAACEDLGVAPGACIMVGDRIDNDIAPARALGMATVLFRTGRHAAQQPRTWLETPDQIVSNVPALSVALSELVGKGQARD